MLPRAPACVRHHRAHRPRSGVIGAGLGLGIIYAGAIEEGLAEDIFKEETQASVKAHSPVEAPAAAVAALRRPAARGFAASFSQ